MALDYYSSKTLSSSDYSCDPWSYPHVTSASFFDLMPLIPATPPLTVSLSQLVDPLGNGDQDECITISPPSLLSFLVSDPHPCTETPAVPPGGQSPLPKVSKNRTHKPEYALPPDMLLDSPFAETSSDDEYHDSASDVSSPGPTTPQHIHYALSSQTVTVQRGPGEPGKINGHPIVRYSDGSYRCMSIVTASGKVSQYTRKRERAPHIGQPCSQTFRGRDEIGRHLKASRWHKKLDEECKPLTCDVCGQRLSRKDALGRHIRALHPSTSLILHRSVNSALTSTPTARTKGEGAQIYNNPQQRPSFE